MIINTDWHLLIEDKVNALESDGQTDRYVVEYRKVFEKEGKKIDPTKVMMVYCKTGNESLGAMRRKPNCGILTRKDILEVFSSNRPITNDIPLEFRAHLEENDRQTVLYRSHRPEEWGVKATQGFFSDLELRLSDANIHADWNYQSNANGGMWVFFFGGSVSSQYEYDFYLQIQRTEVTKSKDEKKEKIRNDLYLRVSNSNNKIFAHHLRELLKRVEEVASNSYQGRIWVKKPDRFGAGRTAAIARLSNSEAGDFMSICPDGKVDLEKTAEWLVTICKFVKEVSGQEKSA